MNKPMVILVSALGAMLVAGLLVWLYMDGATRQPGPGTVQSEVPQETDTGPAVMPPSVDVLPDGATVREVDGGPDYYSKFANGLPGDDSFFPVGVWVESVLSTADTAVDAAAGINTYVDLTSNSTVKLIRDAGMHAMPSVADPDASGYTVADEVDMWAGPGDSVWSGKYPGNGEVCLPPGVPCGYTILKQLRSGFPANKMTYANYGKGVTFWESDEEATLFINGLQDVVSADNYWFTDPNICGASEGGAIVKYTRDLTQAECRRAANYGWTVERLRKLQGEGKKYPVWAFVEVGHPSGGDNDPTITGPEIRAAVWSSIIHGARGVVYFNHNFGGPCFSQHVLRDSCGAKVRPVVTELNKQLQDLAPVLNAPFVDGITTATGGVDSVTKLYKGDWYVIAGSSENTKSTAEFSTKCARGSVATVVGENRRVPMVDGVFRDEFADGNAVHIYRVRGDCAQ